MDLTIRRPDLDDTEQLIEFFTVVLVDTFIKEGIEAMGDDLKKTEIETKKQYLKDDLRSNGELRYFLLAEDKGRIVGTIEYGHASELIDRCTIGEYEDLFEVGTVFVRPEYQDRVSAIYF